MNFEGLYTLQTPGKIIAGVNSIEKIAEATEEFGASKVLIITDMGVWNAGLVEKPIKILESAGVKTEVINNVPPEPEVGQVTGIFNSIKEKDCQLVIGIGGGSSIDTAKVIAALLANDTTVSELLGTDKVKNKGVPTLMIPTTAGTGAEATQNAIVLVPEEELKVGIVSSKLIPDCVILDPAMTVKLPPAITASTGMDALTHAIECYISKKANPISDMFALRAIRLICGSIRKAYNDGNDMNARHDMILGSMFGGICIASSSTTAVHALAYPLGGKYRIPHGLSNAMLLPYVMEFNMDVCVEKFKNIAFEMGYDVKGLSGRESAEKMVENLYSLNNDLNIKSNLKDKGITDADLDSIVDAASKVTRLLDNSPKKLTKDDMRAIYMKLL